MKCPSSPFEKASSFVYLLFILSIGCSGPNGPARYEVHGTVTFDGRPVPAGEIVFEPDATQGNSGPQTRASIHNGEYCTPKGKGSVPGPVLVQIRAYDGEPNPESQIGRELAPAYRTTLELPQENSKQNFDVPTSHTRGH